MLKSILVLILFVTSLPIFAAPETVATVNGKAITNAQFQKAYIKSKHFVSGKTVTKKGVLEDLINRELGLQKAYKNKLDTNPIVREKIEDILYHAQISKDLEKKLAKIVVSDDDVKKYYKTHKEYRTSHILLRVIVQPSAKDLKAATKRALEIYSTLKKEPGKFEELAKKFSQSSTAANGGDMGFQPAVSLAPEYYAAIKGSKPGHITSPVKTQFGIHIIKVVAIKDYKAINIPLYKKIVYDRKRDAIIADYFKGLRSKAKVTINKKSL